MKKIKDNIIFSIFKLLKNNIYVILLSLFVFIMIITFGFWTLLILFSLMIIIPLFLTLVFELDIGKNIGYTIGLGFVFWAILVFVAFASVTGSLNELNDVNNDITRKIEKTFVCNDIKTIYNKDGSGQMLYKEMSCDSKFACNWNKRKIETTTILNDCEKDDSFLYTDKEIDDYYINLN